LDRAVRVLVHGGFVNLNGDRIEACGMVRKLIELALNPIANGTWPPAWTSFRMPRMKVSAQGYIKHFGDRLRGGIELFQACGFVLDATGEFLDMPDAATLQRIEATKKVIAQLSAIVDAIDSAEPSMWTKTFDEVRRIVLVVCCQRVTLVAEPCCVSTNSRKG
jgi:hypothetical protein